MNLLLTETIDAPPDRVWEVVADVKKWQSTIEGIQKIELLSERSSGVGTRWRETRVMFGKEAVEEMGISGWDPKRSYTVTARARGPADRGAILGHASG